MAFLSHSCMHANASTHMHTYHKNAHTHAHVSQKRAHTNTKRMKVEGEKDTVYIPLVGITMAEFSYQASEAHKAKDVDFQKLHH